MSTLTVNAVQRRTSFLQTLGALPVLMAGTFMIVLDFFIVNVALPSIQADLGASASAIEWVVAGYALTFATFLITGARLGDRIGRRRTFCLGLLLFTLASAICGLAPDPDVLIAARLVQGVAGALISPQVLAIVGVEYQGAERIRAITVYGMVMGLAAATAQLIGGVLMQADLYGLGWRAVFLINLPIGAIALVLAPRLIPESRSGESRGLDLLGTALLIAGLIGLLLPLVEGRQQSWPAWAISSLIASPLLLGAFGVQQWRQTCHGGSPLLDLTLFRQSAFSTGLLTQFAFWCGQASFFLVLALYLQEGRGLDPLHAGLVFTILATAYLVTSLRAPKLTLRYGRNLLAVAALTLAAGHALLALGADMSSTDRSIVWLLPGLILVGAGMGLGITPLVSTVMAGVDASKAGSVLGLLSTMQQLGNAVGVAITGLVFFGALQFGSTIAFELSAAQLCGLLVMVAALTRILPRVNA
jgi:EmrB/QacA subfamily drug resistance transporter